MAKYTAKAKERVSKYGITYLSYKINKRIVCEIEYPNEFAEGYRMHGNGFCYDLHPTIEKPKQSAEEYLKRVYDAFGGVEIIYL